MKTETHTPTLAVERGAQGHLLIVDHYQEEVLARIEGIGPESVKIADKIVRAVNAHEELIEALKEASTMLRSISKDNALMIGGLSANTKWQADRADKSIAKAEGRS